MSENRIIVAARQNDEIGNSPDPEGFGILGEEAIADDLGVDVSELEEAAQSQLEDFRVELEKAGFEVDYEQTSSFSTGFVAGFYAAKRVALTERREELI